MIADRFSGWPTVLFCGGSTASSTKLIDTMKTYFSTYGIPEELASDGGKTFVSYETQQFLSNYGVHHRVSSVAYPHSNQRAELAVKSMKRLLRENVGGDGKLNTDSFQRAVMQYRNTPDRDTERSPAQVIFGRQLRDFLPAPLTRYKPQPQWLLLQEDRERALRKRALMNTKNLEHGTKALVPLEVHDTVQVQNQVGNKPSRWDITGTVIEVRDHDQYVIRVHGSGRVTLRNRKFLKKITPYCLSPRPSIINPPHHVPEDVAHDPPQPEELQQQQDRAQPSVGDQQQGVQHREVEGQGPEQVPDVPAVPLTSPAVTSPPTIPQDNPAVRQSTRSRQEPQRLNIGSWNSKSYDAPAMSSQAVLPGHGSWYPDGMTACPPGNGLMYHAEHPQPLVPSMMTTPYSVVHTYGLHHNVPGGGGGITEYGVPSGVQNHFQTQPTYVNNSWAGCPQSSQPVPRYYGYSRW